MLIMMLDDKIVVFGMSCSGKTTFAQQLDSHDYYCFDALFKWHLIETLGLSIAANYKHIREVCKSEKYVLDGWHLSDKKGLELPEEASVYVVYSEYAKIIDQYRIPVCDPDEHLSMYIQWYQDIDYQALNAKYIRNEGEFRETSYDEFLELIY